MHLKSNRMVCHSSKMKEMKAESQVHTKEVAFHQQLTCNTCKRFKMKIIRFIKVGLLMVALTFVHTSCAAGSAPRQVGPVFGKRLGDNNTPNHLMNALPMESSEEQQLHHLHQVVDSMTNLLNEQELQHQQQQQHQIHSKVEPLKASIEGPELMSESEIRLALEELEKVQQQEKQMAAAESRSQPVVATTTTTSFSKSNDNARNPPQTNVQMQTQSPYAGVLDELAEELADEQLRLASQEAERILKQKDYPAVKTEIEKSTVVTQPTTTHRPQSDLQVLSSNTSGPQPLPSPQSLYIGSLDSLNSELGPTLTDDFYSFHGEQKVAQERPSTKPEQQQLESNQRQSSSFDNPYPFNDLDSAAQTRNFRQEASQLGGFPPQQQGTFRFDVTSNRPILPQAAPSHRPQQEQAGTFVSSTENYWRPAQQDPSNGENQFNNQQFGRGFSLNQQLPALPKSKFHSLPPTPFPQAPPQPIQSDHVHFTGHSFIPASSSQQFILPQANLQRDNRIFTTTSTPMISVLSGSDTSNGNSVSWDPPATINPPPAGPRVFNSIYPAPNHQLPELQTFFPPTSTRSQPPLVFNQVPFQIRPEPTNRAPPQHKPPPQLNVVDSRPEVTSTELDLEPPETSTYEQVQPSVTSTPRTILGASQLSVERETATTELQPSSRLLNNNNKPRGNFFTQDSPLPVTTTASSIQNGFSRPFNLRNQQQSVAPITTTSTTTTTISPETSTNTTKKDDMVIYYYYYYDDNKNTTVVARNQTTRPPTLDEAIEADSGVEDTPYIEDSAPINHLNRNRHQSTTSTTTVPTTRKQTESTPLRLSSSRVVQPSSTLKPSSKKQESRILNDERRIIPDSSIRATQQQTADQFSNPFTPTPMQTSPINSFRPAGFNNRPISSVDPSLTRFRPETTEASPVSGSRINKLQPQVEASRNLLNQLPVKPKLTNNSPTPIVTSTASSSVSSRASNANRYGTSNNNLFLESYGIDPSSTPFGHSDTAGHHQKNWQAVPTTGISSGVNKKQHLKPVVSLPERPVQKSDQNNQNFASQRQSNLRNVASLPPKVNQPVAPKLASQVSTSQVVGSPGKNFFSEASNKPVIGESNQDFDRSPPHSPSSDTERINSQLEDQVNNSKENLQRFNNNGRPSTMDGNTRNGFTKAPPQISSSHSSFTSTPFSTTTTQRAVSTSSESSRTSSSPVSSAHSTLGSTILSGNAQQSTSFPPTVSYSQTESVSSVSSSSSESSSSAPSSTDSSTTLSSSSSTTEANPSSSSTTDTSDRSTSVTRRKFGNRNNRFQTRLDSISNASKSTTSTTTPAPAGSTSTTKRPVISTTRRSSKQLFAGRRRLNSLSSTGGSAPIAASQASNSTISSSPVPTESSVSSVSTSTSRAKFGNSFTARLRSTTESSNPVAARIAAGSRARLAFSRTSKATQITSTRASVLDTSTTTSSSTGVSSASSVSDETVSPVNEINKVTEKSINEASVDETVEASPANTIDDEPTDKKDQSTSSSASTAITTTTSTTTSSPETGRAKPRVRPLFASRQKNSALFGNRRSTTTNQR